MEMRIGQEDMSNTPLTTVINADDILIRPLQGNEYKHAHTLSFEDYSNQEWLTNMKYRFEAAPDLFLGCFVSNKLIGYITGSQTDKPQFTLESITHHISGGETACLHRIWVHKDYRKQGIATKIFDAFRRTVSSLDPQPKRICCGTRESRVAPFLKFGFKLVERMVAEAGVFNQGVDSFRMEFKISHDDKPPMLKDLQNATIRLFEGDDYIQAWMLEANSYVSDEAASLQHIQYRFQHAPHLSMGYYVDNEMIGFAIGVQSDKPTLTTESSTKHVPHGETVCLHSVCVKEDYRRKGISSTLLKSYMDHIKQLTPRPKRICLVAHDYLIPLYTQAGFSQTGISDFQWGSAVWYGLQFTLDS